jgi:hypothetical protein
MTRWRSTASLKRNAPVSSAERLLVALDVQQHVVRLVHLGDRIGELAATPVLEPVHLAAAGRDHALVALDHGRNLLALVRMDQEYDLVMPHESSLRLNEPPARGYRGSAARSPASQPNGLSRVG